MRFLLLALLAFPAVAAAQAEQAERTLDPAKQVVVIVNDAVPESVAIGKYYAGKRGVPEGNLCHLKTTDQEAITWPDFREQILKPLGRFLEKFPDALYVVPVWGVPSRITEEDPDNDAPKDEPDNTLTKFVTNRDYGCVDAEIALIPQNGHEVEGWLDSEVFEKNEHITLSHKLFLVSRLDGPTVAIAKALVDKAIYAETYGAAGDAYVDTRGLDPKSPLAKTDDEIRKATDTFQAHGIPLHHEDTVAVQDVSTLKDCLFYWGWYASDYNGTQPFTFRPGAVAAHLHSSSAVSIRHETKYWVGPFLAHGATCTAGTVFEPLVTGFPSMSIVFDRMLEGYTWGEATAMGNRKLSWMAVFVGDPLYAPFAKGMKDVQAQNRSLATEGYTRAAAAIDAADLDGAQKVIDDIRKIGVPMEGATDVAFLAREIASRRVGKSSGTVADLAKRLDEAHAARERGDDKAAQAAIEKALVLSPMSFDANFALGCLYVETGKAQQALAWLEKAQKTHPAFPGLPEPYGRALAANGKFAEAIPLLQAALDAGAGSDCLATMGECYLKTRQAAKAIELLADATKKDPHNRTAFVSLARAYEESKDVPSALKVLKEAVKIYPETTADISPYKGVWMALQTTALHSKDKREKEDVDWVIRDFDNTEYMVPTPGVAIEINKQADQAVSGDSPVSLGTIPTEVMKVPGLPRLVMGNASSAELTVFLKGSTSRVVRFRPLVTGPGGGQDNGVYPGDYDVILVVQRDKDKTVLSGKITFELNKRYGMVMDNSLAMSFPIPK